MPRQRELIYLGYSGLIPFAAGALSQWAPAGIASADIVLAAREIMLAYGAIIVGYMAGMGAGALIVTEKPATDRLWPGMAATLAAWVAIWPAVGGVGAGALVRHLVLIGALLYLLFRDLNAVKAGGLPDWYAHLRIRLTAGASASLAISAVATLLRADL